MPFQEEIRYRILREITDRPDVTQRELARDLGVSVGKINYCIRALVRKGLVKARNFTNSNNKAAYTYVLTPKGAREKLRIAYEFLEHKIREYDALRQEIAALSGEVAASQRRRKERESR